MVRSSYLTCYAGTPKAVSVNNAIVTIFASDGDPSEQIAEEVEKVDRDGRVDFIEEADDEANALWRTKVATYLVHEGDWCTSRTGQQFVLQALPKHYKLYIHRKGERNNPRTDYYLYGSSTVSRPFRSPAEFALHAKWLAFGMPRDAEGDSLCECTYCSGTEQKEITKVLNERAKPDPSQRMSAKRQNGRSHSNSVNKASSRREPKMIQYTDYTALKKDASGVVRGVPVQRTTNIPYSA